MDEGLDIPIFIDKAWCVLWENKKFGTQGVSQLGSDILNAVEKALGIRLEREVTPPWLYKPGWKNQMKLDGYHQGLKLCIEYDGPQHWNRAKFEVMNRGNSTFGKVLYCDSEKDRLAKENGFLMVRIKQREVDWDEMDYEERAEWREEEIDRAVETVILMIEKRNRQSCSLKLAQQMERVSYRPETPDPVVETKKSSPNMARPRRVVKKIATLEPSPKMTILEEKDISNMVDLREFLCLYLDSIQKRGELKEELGKLLERANQIQVEIASLNRQHELLSRRGFELVGAKTEESDDDSE